VNQKSTQVFNSLVELNIGVYIQIYERSLILLYSYNIYIYLHSSFDGLLHKNWLCFYYYISVYG